MLNRFASLMLMSTSIAPILLTYAWVAIQSDKLFIGIILFCVCIVLVLLCIALLRYAQKNLEKSSFKIKSIEVADGENMSFLLLYLLPLFTSSFETLNWSFWIPAIIMFGAVAATGYGYHFNPLLGLFRWHFYKVGTLEGVTYILVTKKQIRNVLEDIDIVQLTEYIIIDVGITK